MQPWFCIITPAKNASGVDLSEIMYFIILLGVCDYHDVIEMMENYVTVKTLSCFYKMSYVGFNASKSFQIYKKFNRHKMTVLYYVFQINCYSHVSEFGRASMKR